MPRRPTMQLPGVGLTGGANARRLNRGRRKAGWRGSMIPIVVAVTITVLAAGQASAADVSYFDVTRGAHPHDVAPAPDGNVWYTAQSQGALGILNPKTGQASQVSLGKGSAPHG